MTSKTKYYIILAGIDGVGKSTLSTIAPELFYNSKIVSPGKIIQLNTKALAQGGKQAVDKKTLTQEIKKEINNGRSIYYKTTLVNSLTEQLDLLNLAKEAGYKTILYYVDTTDMEAIHTRNIENNHGVSFDKLEEELDKSHNNLFEMLPHVDHSIIFNNAFYFNVSQINWN